MGCKIHDSRYEMQVTGLWKITSKFNYLISCIPYLFMTSLTSIFCPVTSNCKCFLQLCKSKLNSTKVVTSFYNLFNLSNMNIKIILLAFSVAAISSCSTAYRSGQTPDDVYYSPARVVEEDYSQEKQKTESVRRVYRDREIQMAIYDRRWRDFDDDFNYSYDPYRYAYSYGYYYNPYYCYYPVYITNVSISNPKNTVPRMTNLGSYNNTTYSIINNKTGVSTYTGNKRIYNNSNNDNNYIRRILTNPVPSSNENSTRSSSDNNTRSYSPSSGSSSGSSSSGSGAPVSRPVRSR